MNIIRKLVRSGEIRVGSDKQKDELFRSLRELIAMLFAVVFGVGLEKISEANSGNEYFMLATVYTTILASWWGYNYGTIIGPKETNLALYFIDCLIVVLYWFLIEYAFSLDKLLVLYGVMFLLYAAWEAIRLFHSEFGSETKKTIIEAFTLNAVVSAIFFLAYLYANRNGITASCCSTGIILIGIMTYRIIVYKIYSSTSLGKSET